MDDRRPAGTRLGEGSGGPGEDPLQQSEVVDVDVGVAVPVEVPAEVSLLVGDQRPLVAEAEADLNAGKISVKSPIGLGLLGKAVGDKAKIITPGGKITFEILDISI